MSAGQSVEQTQACEDKAQQRCDRCKADASKLFFPLNIAAADLCDAELLLEVTACLATAGLV